VLTRLVFAVLMVASAAMFLAALFDVVPGFYGQMVVGAFGLCMAGVLMETRRGWVR